MLENEVILPTKITDLDVENVIASSSYYVFPDTTHTVCCITLINGYTVIGESACVNPSEFNKEMAEQISFQQARKKIWMLEGYLLKEVTYGHSTYLSSKEELKS